MRHSATAHVGKVRREIVIVDHAFHERTVSSQFLIELLHGPEATVHFVEPDAPNLLELLQASSSRALVFIQLRPTPRMLRALGHQNVA